MRLFLILAALLLSLTAPAFAARSDALAVQRILERYTETLGGVRAVDALSSVSIEGEQIQGGKTYSFLMRKKRPDSIRYRLSAGESSVVCGYNGRSGWQRVDASGEVTIEDLTGDALALLRDEADFDSPLFRYLEKSWNTITLVGNDRVGGRNVYVLELKSLARVQARYYLDTRSSLLLKRERVNVAGKVTLETLYRDYREVEGYQFAFEVENLVDGEQVSLIKIDTIDVNPGLLSFYFEKPRG